MAIEPPRFLVTTAAGTTGSAVVLELIRRGLSVRAFVHRLGECSERLSRAGAQVVEGDLLDIASIRAALEGIRRVYWCFPPADRLLEATAGFVVAARDAGVESVANMSQMHVREGHPSALTRQHWLAERMLDNAGIGVTHLRSTFFAENYLRVCLPTIATAGRFFLPHGDGAHAPVSVCDIARVASGVLTREEIRNGEVLKVTGPVAMSQRTIAETFTSVLGRPIEYVDVPLDAWRAAGSQLGLSPFLLDHLCYAAEDCKRGRFSEVTDVVARIGGHQPQTFAEFVMEHAVAFGNGSVARESTLTGPLRVDAPH